MAGVLERLREPRPAIPGSPRFGADWLALREPADTAARSAELLEPLRAHLAGKSRLVVRDLGCGTGSQGRWLSPRLGGKQRWVLHDRDPELLGRAVASLVAHGVTVETSEGDLTELRAADLEGTSLVTASALLDLLTFDEVEALATACAEAGVPALFTLSVVGRVSFSPSDSLDAEFAAAFNAHQRRRAGGRRLLGPDAVAAATETFSRRGAVVRTASSPWRLGPGDPALIREWLRGWVGAAGVQRPDLAPHAEGYLRRHLDANAAGGLRVVVQHSDLLAIPAGMES
ncbi:class I SAM-dependent methyltransferase [Amycolatopsis sp. H20-H5]|uniref:class I SAM-dependent methyltransferase n=1 Tax=Amycolatopsis sp. H20-H5 TaxID=3046309 RepID=UPI002DBB266E|nr:class I SAM-dependent methyltransferase [Amycolatopsis sp. H20-H5]MEC3982250.1 class I SAM-dependent methyltransferase [Amycolatopsis sp. H20-H5]